LIEIFSIPALTSLSASDREPGNYSFDPLLLGSKPANLEKYKVNELKNGRLAMLAFSGIITQAALYGGKPFPCKNYFHCSLLIFV
jgi:light-harvesting complex I chlorophyll a/b binding protein 1